MTASRPTLNQIYDRVYFDIISRIPSRESKFKAPKVTFIKILSLAIAGVSHGLYGFAEALHASHFLDKARAGVLDRWGFVFGVRRKKETKAFGYGEFKIIGNYSRMKIGTIFEGGERKYVSIDIPQKTGDSSILVRVSSIESGKAFNLEENIPLKMVSPIDGIDPNGSVGEGGITGGADQERDSSYRERIIDRIRRPPQGGADSDYERWAKEIPGVTRAFVYPKRRGAGTVDIAFVMDGEDDILSKPESAIFKEVARNIKRKAPSTAIANVIPLIPKPLNLKIEISPPTDEVKASVVAEVKDLIRRESHAGKADGSVGTIRLSRLREAISQAKGEDFHTLIFPTEDTRVGDAEIIVFGGIEWID